MHPAHPAAPDSARRTLSAVLVFSLAVTLIVLPGPAIAATTVRAFSAANNAVATGPGNIAAPLTLLNHGPVVVTAAMTTDVRAGVRAAGAVGVAGTVRLIPACTLGPCNDSYRGAGQPRLRAGHFAAWVEFSFLQPRRATSAAFGFAIELAVRTNAGWFVAIGYFSSGTTASATVQTVHVNLLVDLGVRRAPTILAFDVSPIHCRTAASCP